MSAEPIILDVEQGTDRWAQARCGRITASRAADVIAMTKKGEGAGRRDYRTEILVERLTGVPVPQFVSKEMLWGLQQEPFARAAYEMHAAVFVDQVGFVISPDYDFFGCSPDGYIGDDGMLQIKCPNTTTHLGWLMGGVIPAEHVPQMVAEMAVTGRKWVDFVSFDPRLPEHLQLFVKRYHRNEKHIDGMITEVVHFHRECESVLKALPPGPQVVTQVLDWPKEEETL